MPTTTAAREALAVAIGADGQRLLPAVDAVPARPWLQDIPAVATWRRGWAAPYPDPPGPRRWREVQERVPAAEWIASPDDADARASTKRALQGVGSKVHFTDTGADDQPHLLTQVLTTPATTPDGVMGPASQHDLAQRQLLPGPPRLDSGDVDAE